MKTESEKNKLLASAFPKWRKASEKKKKWNGCCGSQSTVSITHKICEDTYAEFSFNICCLLLSSVPLQHPSSPLFILKVIRIKDIIPNLGYSLVIRRIGKRRPLLSYTKNPFGILTEVTLNL